MSDLSITEEKSASGPPGESTSTKTATAYKNIARELQPEALTNPDVVRMIINDNDRLQSEKAGLSEELTKLGHTETENAVLKEKIKTSTAFEVISFVTTTIGSLLIGGSINPPNWWTLIAGAILIIAGIVVKVIKIK